MSKPLEILYWTDSNTAKGVYGHERSRQVYRRKGVSKSPRTAFATDRRVRSDSSMMGNFTIFFHIFVFLYRWIVMKKG